MQLKGGRIHFGSWFQSYHYVVSWLQGRCDIAAWHSGEKYSLLGGQRYRDQEKNLRENTGLGKGSTHSGHAHSDLLSLTGPHLVIQSAMNASVITLLCTWSNYLLKVPQMAARKIWKDVFIQTIAHDHQKCQRNT